MKTYIVVEGAVVVYTANAESVQHAIEMHRGGLSREVEYLFTGECVVITPEGDDVVVGRIPPATTQH